MHALTCTHAHTHTHTHIHTRTYTHTHTHADTHTHTDTRTYARMRTSTLLPTYPLLGAAGGDVFHSNGNLIPKNSVARSHTEFAPADELPIQAHCFAPGPKQVNTRWTNIVPPGSDSSFVSISGDVNTSTISVTNPPAYLGGQFTCRADRQFIANFYLFSTRTGVWVGGWVWVWVWVWVCGCGCGCVWVCSAYLDERIRTWQNQSTAVIAGCFNPVGLRQLCIKQFCYVYARQCLFTYMHSTPRATIVILSYNNTELQAGSTHAHRAASSVSDGVLFPSDTYCTTAYLSPIHYSVLCFL